MAKKSPKSKESRDLSPPKQRTRQHVIASLSTNFVERVIYERGWSAQRVENDYGYDLVLQTFSSEGFVEPGFVLLQLKAQESVTKIENHRYLSFSISTIDYRTWMKEAYPVFLVVYDATEKQAYWSYVQKYFTDQVSRRPVGGAKSVRVRIPTTDRFTDSTLTYMKERKVSLMETFEQVEHD